jgi:peptidoglycan/LPS O-acetylase OafA/YrhL
VIALTSGDNRNRGLDGLRALAVGAVMAFHAGQRWAVGGYLGVDAFFVLSGFLITGLLLDERSRTGAIDLGRFWARRMARLIPALAIMITAVMVIVAVNHPEAVSALRADAVGALTYVANWRFLVGQRGYFGQTAPSSLLEHTWSLSIEEQFYLLWPLVVVALARTRRPRVAVAAVAALGAVVSATATVLLARSGASTSRLYFGTDTRLQAILIGATLAACFGDRAAIAARAQGLSQRARTVRNGALHLLAVGGLAATALLWWRLDGGSPHLFRGGTTVAALATAAVIPSLVFVPNGLLGRVLGIAPLRALGVISYGVYLWHWPVQLLLTHAETGLEGTPLHILRVAVTIGAATISYLVVEEPLRRHPPLRPPILLRFSSIAASLAVAAVVLAGAAIPKAPTVLAAVPAAEIATTSSLTTLPPTTTITAAPVATSVVTAVPKPRPAPPPVTAPRPVYRTEILGDSVAQSIAQGMASSAGRYGLSLLDHGILGCGVAPVGGFRLRGQEHEIGTDCRQWESTWTARVQATGADIAVIQVGRHEVLDTYLDERWQSVLDAPMAAAVAHGLDRAIEIASGKGAPVVLLTAPYFQTGEAPDGRPWPENDPQRVNRFNQLVRDAAARHPRTTVVDLGHRTNPNGRYASTVSGVAMRKDGVHYTYGACAWFAPWLSPQIRAAKGG